MNRIDNQEAPIMRKIHTDTKIFGIVTVFYWLFSLLVWCVTRVDLTLSNVLFNIVDLLTDCVMVSAPFFAFVLPVILLVSMTIHSVNEKRFYAYPLIIAVVNVCHTILMYHLMESWV